MLLFAALLCAWSCLKEAEPMHMGSGRGSIVLSFNSGSAVRMQTRALSSADSLLLGYKFENILVILTDNTNKVVGKVYKSYPYDPSAGGNDPHQDEVAGKSSLNLDTVRFSGLLPGNYIAYAYANINCTAWQSATSSEQIANQEFGVAIDDDFSPYLDRQLKVMSGLSDIPGAPATAMLMTGSKEIPVGLTTKKETLTLSRPVVRFNVYINNSTDYPVHIDDLHFSYFNPDKAYLLPHTDGEGLPEIPDGVSYREMPAFDPSGSDVETVVAGEETCVYSRFIYENAVDGAYKVFTTMKLKRSLDPADDLEMSLGQSAFGVINYETISSMGENEYVDILLINPRKTTRSARMYYGIGDTGLAWESFGFSDFTKFFARAQAIYNESASYVYEGFTYNDWRGNNNNSGLAGWTGNLNDDAYKGNTFDYTGARNRYFRRLTKHDSHFSIDGLSTNPPSSTSLTQLKIVQGVNVSDRFPSNMDTGNLIQFVNDNSSDANYGKYLKSDNAWSAQNEAAAKVCKLSWEANGTNNQDHQFVLFGKPQAGGIMKRLLTGSNKEANLSYMTRNEDINVIINVFYADQAGNLAFEVVNDDWDEAGTTTSTYTFD